MESLFSLLEEPAFGLLSLLNGPKRGLSKSAGSSIEGWSRKKNKNYQCNYTPLFLIHIISNNKYIYFHTQHMHKIIITPAKWNCGILLLKNNVLPQPIRAYWLLTELGLWLLIKFSENGPSSEFQNFTLNLKYIYDKSTGYSIMMVHSCIMVLWKTCIFVTVILVTQNLLKLRFFISYSWKIFYIKFKMMKIS